MGIEITPSKEVGMYALTNGANTDTGVINIEVGKTYYVTTESGTFTAVCKDFNGAFVYVGNLALDGGDDTGETYLVIASAENGFVCDGNGGSCLRISTPETIHPIDPKYLPGVCLPVVELETVITLSPDATGTFPYADVEKFSKFRDTPVGIVKYQDHEGNIRSDLFERLENSNGDIVFQKSGYDWCYGFIFNISIINGVRYEVMCV